MIKIAILSTGSELLDGRVQDTNSSYIATRLSEEGLGLSRIVSCGDTREEITTCLQFLTTHHQVVIISGGLGPTSDDLTREAVSDFTGKPLVLDEKILDALKERYRQRGRTFDPVNTKQAFIPECATPLPNPHGTACGFTISGKTASNNPYSFFVAPGVPREIRPMFEDHILPAILAKEKVIPMQSVGLRTFGLPESAVGKLVDECELPVSVTTSFRAQFPEVHVVLKTRDPSTDLKTLQKRVIEKLGSDKVFTLDLQRSLPEFTAELLLQEGATVAVAESCTAGLLGSMLTQLPGSSRYFTGGMITYSNSSKEKLLGVNHDLLARDGAVSASVACEMASHARTQCDATYALSITGIAGPDGGSAEKPVGTYYVGIANRDTVKAYHLFFNAERDRVRRYACYSALDILRRTILSLPPPAMKL